MENRTSCISTSHAFVITPLTTCTNALLGQPVEQHDSRRRLFRIAASRRSRAIPNALVMSAGDGGHSGGDVGSMDVSSDVGSPHVSPDAGSVPIEAPDGSSPRAGHESSSTEDSNSEESHGDTDHAAGSLDPHGDGAVYSAMQGPSQAPTQAGISTAGLSEKDTKFITACYDADVTVIESMLDEGQDPNIADVNKRTALHFCAGNGLPTLCDKLVKAGVNINEQDILGFTPLHMATGYRKLETVRFLVEAGADANIASFKGDLAVEIAENILENTPEKRFFMPNEMYSRMKTIVEILDEATEEEEDDEEEDGRVEVKSDGVREITEETGSTKFVVRVKPKGESPQPPAPAPPSNVDVTIRVKEPKSE